MQQTDVARAASALQFIDAGAERGQWVKTLTAAKAAGLDFETVDEWSSTAPNYLNANDVKSVWRGLNADGGIGPGTLFHLAKQAGWRDDGKPEKVQHHPARKPAPVAARKPLHNAQTVWDMCAPATMEHGYISRKNGAAEGLRVYPATAPRLTIADQNVANWLALPCRTPSGDLQSLQFIPPIQGKKLNLPGCTMSGGMFVVGEFQADGLAYLCEGISAAWAAWKATGRAAIVCFGWCNVRKIAAALVTSNPALSLVLLPDAGKESSAAEIAAGLPRCAWCELPECWPSNSDVGDYAASEGMDMLETLLSDAVKHPTPANPDCIDQHGAATFRFCDARDGTDTTHALTELGNAHRLQDLHGDTVRYIPESKGWLVWRDGAWAASPDGGLVRSLAAELGARVYREGDDYLQDADFFAKWSRNSQRQQTINAAVGLLSDMPTMRVPLADIDANPWLAGINQGRQVIDLKTGTVRAAQPADLITKSLGISTLGQSGNAVRWLEFLNQVFQGDSELIDWLQRWCGYLLTGSTREQVLLFGYGHGANGKSVFAEVLRSLMGDYATPIQSETLTETRRTAGSASPDLAALVGARMAMSTETEDGASLAESLVKSLTAGDALSVRPLYGTPFTFLPGFKLLMLGNHKPIIRGTDLGIWRRIRLLPFTRTFAPEERDPELTAKLKAEAPHIVAWMLQGCLAWQARGLTDVPTSIAKQTEEYRSDMDTLGQWLADCCIQRSGLETPNSELYQSYQQWARDNGFSRPMTANAFGRRMTERGYAERRTKTARLRNGVALLTSTPRTNDERWAA